VSSQTSAGNQTAAGSSTGQIDQSTPVRSYPSATANNNKRKKGLSSPEDTDMDTEHELDTFQTAVAHGWDRLSRLVQEADQTLTSTGKYDEWVKEFIEKIGYELHRSQDLLLKVSADKSALMASMDRENELLRQENERLRADLRQLRAAPSSATGSSYASVTSRSLPVPHRKTTSYTKSVTMKEMTGKEAAQIVKMKLLKEQDQIRAVVRPTANSVLISCDSQEKLHRISKLLEDPRITCTDRQKLKPQIRIEAVNKKDFITDKFLDVLNERNDQIFDPSSKVVHSYPNWRDSTKLDVIVETTGACQEKLLGQRSLLFDFDSLRVYEHLRIRQCVQCLGLGHKKDQCKACPRCLQDICKDRKSCAVRKICFRCGGDHVKKDCPPENSPKCSVCLHHGQNFNGQHSTDYANHPMLSRECPSKRAGEEAMRHKTDYGS
jgi:hypothetical protein